MRFRPLDTLATDKFSGAACCEGLRDHGTNLPKAVGEWGVDSFAAGEASDIRGWRLFARVVYWGIARFKNGLMDWLTSLKGCTMSKPRFLAVLLTVSGLMLAGCAGSHSSNSVPRSAESNEQKTAADIRRISAANASRPHGAEVESGTPMTITDGNVHIIIPPSATVVRTADGFVVTYSTGRTRKFSKNAVAVVGGEFHRYAAVSK